MTKTMVVGHELKMKSKTNSRYYVQLICYNLLIVATNQASTSFAQALQDGLTSSSEYTIRVGPEVANQNCLDCYKSNQLQSINQEQESDNLQYNLSNHRSQEDPDMSKTRSDGVSGQINDLLPAKQERQLEQSAQDSNLNQTSQFGSMAHTNNSDESTTSKTIYSSLVNVMILLKKQLDKSKLKDRIDDNGDAIKHQLGNHDPNSTSIATPATSSRSNSNEDSTVEGQSLYKRLAELPPTNGDQEMANPFNEQNNSGNKDLNAFSTPSMENRGSQTSFKPMVNSDVSSEVPIQTPPSNNYVSGSLSPNVFTDSAGYKMKASSFSNSMTSERLPDSRNSNYKENEQVSLTRKSFRQNLQQPMPESLIYSPIEQPNQPLKPSSSPSSSWGMTENSGQTLPLAGDTQQPTPSTSGKQHHFSFPMQEYQNHNPSRPAYELSTGTTSGYLTSPDIQEHSTQKRYHMSSSRNNRQQHQQQSQNYYPTSSEANEIYDTRTPTIVTSRPRPRSRRSKSTFRPMSLYSDIKSLPRYMRETDYNRNIYMDEQQLPDSSSSTSNDLQETQQMSIQTPRQDHSGIHLQQVYPLPLSSHQPMQRSQQQQQAVYTLAAAPPGLSFRNIMGTQASQMSSSGPAASHESPTIASASIGQPQRDLVNQPQTIQITAVPTGLQNQPLVRVNGAPLALSNLLNNGLYNGMSGFLDPFGRQVVMVNAERRQVDWSFWFWPILLAVTLPLVLGALFVPVFLKTIVMLIQVLQSLGLLLPLTNALTSQIAKASGVSLGQLEQIKS